VAGQVLDAIMELELPLYKEAAQQDKMVDSWPQDIEAIYNTLTEKVDISLLRTEGPITLPKEILLSSPLFEPMLTILKNQIQKSIFSEEAKKKSPLNVNEKSEIYQQVLERWIKSCEPLAEKDRKDLLSFMAAKLALSLSHDKIRLTPYQAIEEFEKEGYLPGELYREALTLQKLLTQAGTYPQAFHFVTNTLSTTFPHQMIEKRLESLAEQIKKAFSPTNLQWLTIRENRSKGGKIIAPLN
jgi:hypothetical protein